MTFTIKDNKVYYKETDLSEFMDIKEMNIDDGIAFVTAEFKAEVYGEFKGVLFAMLEEMDEGNLIDIKEECERCLKEF